MNKNGAWTEIKGLRTEGFYLDFRVFADAGNGKMKLKKIQELDKMMGEDGKNG